MRAVEEYPVREGGICSGQPWKVAKQILWWMDSLHGSFEHTVGLWKACCPLLLKPVSNMSWNISQKYQFLFDPKRKLKCLVVARLSMVDTVLSSSLGCAASRQVDTLQLSVGQEYLSWLVCPHGLETLAQGHPATIISAWCCSCVIKPCLSLRTLCVLANMGALSPAMYLAELLFLWGSLHSVVVWTHNALGPEFSLTTVPSH